MKAHELQISRKPNDGCKARHLGDIYPDGELDFAPPREVRMQLVRIIRNRRPDIVFALDPGATYYRYHYRDHRTAALASADAVGAAMWPLEYAELGPAYKVPDVYYFYTAEPNLKVDIFRYTIANWRRLRSTDRNSLRRQNITAPQVLRRCARIWRPSLNL